MNVRILRRLGLAVLVASGLQAQEPATSPPPGAPLQQATSLLRSGRGDEARRLLLEIVSENPAHGGARTLLGRIELERGALESAREHLEVAAASSPPRPYLTWHLLGRARLLLGEARPARDAWDLALELAPRFAPALLGRAGAALRLGDLEPAVVDLESLLGLGRADPEAALLLAEIRLLEGRYPDAEVLLAEVARGAETGPAERLAADLLTLAARPKPDLPALRVAVGRDPHLARGLLALGIAHLRRGSPDPAASAFRAALATDGRDPVPWLYLRSLGNDGPPPYPRPFPTLARRLEKARLLDEAGDPASAVESRAILERRPHHAAARLLLARAVERITDPGGENLWQALGEYRGLLETLPALPSIEIAAARTARAMRALELAECLADRAARALPRDATAHFLLAAVQTDAGRYDEAARSCRRAIDLGLEEAAVYVTLGFAEFERMNVGESLAAYARALTIDPEAVGGIPSFALASLTTQEFGVLRALLRDHLRTYPDHREALYSLGVMSLRENDLASAQRYFERLERQTPAEPQVHYNLGSIHLRLGNEERGRAAMERFRELKAIEAERWLEHNRAHADRLEARAASASGDSEKAIEIYQRMAAVGIADQDDYLAAGQACLALGGGQQALRAVGWFEKLLATAPFHREALLGLAAAAERLGRGDEARRAREKAELLDWRCERGSG